MTDTYLKLDAFEKAIHSLSDSIDLLQTVPESSKEFLAFRDSCIQRFEYTLELAWKVGMKFLGSKIRAAKPAVRKMLQNGLITEGDLWFDFVNARNMTSHMYDEDVAREVFQVALKFLPEVQKLFTMIKSQ